MSEKAKIEVFTSPTCPHCPHAKKVVQELSKEREDIKFIETSTATHKGQKRSESLGVRSVPTLFIKGPGYPDRIGYVGTPSKSQLNKMVNIALGLESWEEEKKESFFSKISKRINIKIKI